MATSVPRLARAAGSRRLPPVRKGPLARHRSVSGIGLSLPALVFVAILLFLPIFQAIYYSFTDWDGLTAHWLGLSAYSQVLTDSTFWRIVENNALLLLAVPVAIVIPLGIAFLLHQKVWGWRFFRSAYFLPTALSWVVIGLVALRFFAQDGILNDMLSKVGLGFLHTDLLGHEKSALVAVGLTFIWSMIGTNTIVFITGMATLDPHLHEAAQVDGCGQVQTFLRITLPQLLRFIQFAFIITVISAFTGLFSLIYVMTGGGPGYGTTTLEFDVYQTAFSQGYFGRGALLGLVLFVIMAIIGVAQIKLLSRIRGGAVR